MILKGILEDLLVNIDPELYRKYAVIEKGVKVLYVRLQKALYVFLRSVLQFYLKLATALENGFIIMHTTHMWQEKKINGDTKTVAWPVDELNVFHKDSFEVTKFYQ